MKFFRKILINFCFILSFSQAVAEPNILEVFKGLGSVVPDPTFNPMAGAMGERYLKGLRYFGNYKSRTIEQENPLLRCSVQNNCPQDAVTSLIQWLFPNPTLDGNFAPNRRDPSFKDLVSRFTPSTIGAVLNEIAKSKDHYDHQAVAAITQAILKEYEKSKKIEQSQNVQKGEISSPLIRQDYEEKFKKITTEHDSYKKLEDVLEYLKVYSKLSKQEQENCKKNNFQNLPTILGNNTNISPQDIKILETQPTQKQIGTALAFQRALNPPIKKENPTVKSQETITIDPEYKQQAELFARLVVEALITTQKKVYPSEIPLIPEKDEKGKEEKSEYEPHLLNLKKQNQEIYYPDMVTLALLHFGWTISKDKNDIIALLSAMPTVVQVGDLKNYINSHEVYTEKDYLELKDKVQKLDPSEYLNFFHGSQGIEKAGLLGFGFEYFENKFPEKIGYTNIPLFKDKYDPKNPEPIVYEVEEKNKIKKQIPDCGESSLRTVLMFLLFDPFKRIFNIEPLVQNEKVPNLKIHPLLIDFFKIYSNPAMAKSYGARADWMRTTSFLENDIEYVKKAGLEKKFSDAPVCEIEAGLSNMMKVLGAFLGTPPHQTEEKLVDMTPLNTLLTLISTEKTKWTWQTSEKENEISKEKDRNVKIDFYQNGDKIFTWEFTKGHFDIIVPLAPKSVLHKNISQQLLESQKILPVYFTLFSGKFFVPSNLKELNLSSENISFLFYSLDLRDTNLRLQVLNAFTKNHINSLMGFCKRLIDSLKELALLDGRTKNRLITYCFQSSELGKYVIKVLNLTGNEKDDMGQTQLHHAVLRDDLDILKYLVEIVRADVNVKNTGGTSPLHLAVEKGDLEIIKYLVEIAKADVNIKNEMGVTPLHLAVEKGNLEIFKYLVEIGKEDVNIKNEMGVTPLHLAVEKGNLEIFKYLAEIGKAEEVGNITDKDGRSLLHWASYHNKVDIVKFLVEIAKADVNVKDKDSRTPLHFAIEKGNLDIVKFLVEIAKADVNVKDKNSRTPLHFAIEKGNLDIFKYLFEMAKVDVNVKDIYGKTFLHFAIEKGNLNIVKYLVETGKANVHAIENNDGRTPLYFAVFRNNLEIFKYLFEISKEEVNVADMYNDTPLHWAAYNQNLEIVKSLVEIGKADVNAKETLGGKTPLHLAVEQGNLEIIKYLVEMAKVDVNVKDRYGKTSLHFAIQKGNLKIIKYLVEMAKIDVNVKDEDGRNPLYFAIEKGNLEIIKYLVEIAKAEVNVKNKSGVTPLHLAVEQGNLEIIKYLVEIAKADVNVAYNSGRFLLHYAVQKGNLEMVKCLVEIGKADVNVKNKSGATPLHLAVEQGNLEIIKYLVEIAKADVNVKDERNITPLHLAVQEGNFKAVKILARDKAALIATNKEGYTPLGLAEKLYKKEIVKYLLLKLTDNIFDAIEKFQVSYGDTSALRDFIEENHIDVNQRDKDGKTPLYHAIKKNELQIVKLLYKLGATVNEESNTPLIIVAAKTGNRGIFNYLLYKGARIEAVDEDGRTAFHWAAFLQNTDIIKYLMIHQREMVYKKDKQQNNPLHMAVKFGKSGSVKLLVEKKDDPLLQEKNGENLTPMEIATQKNKTEIINYFSSLK